MLQSDLELIKLNYSNPAVDNHKSLKVTFVYGQTSIVMCQLSNIKWSYLRKAQRIYKIQIQLYRIFCVYVLYPNKYKYNLNFKITKHHELNVAKLCKLKYL